MEISFIPFNDTLTAKEYKKALELSEKLIEEALFLRESFDMLNNLNRKKARMNVIIKIVSILTICLASSGVWAQTNTRVIGKIKDLQDGTVVHLSPVNSPLKNEFVLAKKGKFEFNMALDEGGYYQLTIGKVRSVPGGISLSFYLEPGVVKIKGKVSELYEAKLYESKFADGQNIHKKYIKSFPN